MTLIIETLNIRWDSVPGATSWEISVDGVPVSTAGQKARMTKVRVGNYTTIAVVDLPGRTLVQEVELLQVVAA